ncbi:MAG TPA: class I SAM-dependent methyltransferase [Rhizomicrobium sp.]
MSDLESRIKALIAAQGPISVAQFMTQALHDPKGGYYATRDPFGSGGDFVTAPEVSQMFGEMLGLWCIQVWHDQGRPKNARLVELGPGRGTLMSDVLRTLRSMPEFFENLEVVLVEASPVLQKIQQDKLKDSGTAPGWRNRFDETLSDRPLFLLANEFFDALPIRQFVKTQRGWCERMVTLSEGRLVFALAPTPTPSALIPADRMEAPEGGVYESAPAATALAEEIAAIIARQGGGALITDYGFAAPGFGETLQAVASHSFADVLEEPGESDLSAHVDFAALAQAAKHGGACVFGPQNQGDFLVDVGIARRAEKLMATNPAAATTLVAGVERLIAPDQMGTLFKAVALMPDAAPKPPGF